MRFLVLCIVLWLTPFAADAQVLARAPQPTNVAFTADDSNGMLVVAENAGTAYEVGRYRFVRIDREAGRLLGHVDIGVGAGRGQMLFGQRAGSIEATHVFHYSVVPPGEYAFVYWDSSGTNVVTSTYRWGCLSDAAPVYRVDPGAVAVLQVPDRTPHDVMRDFGFARRALLRRLPQGTTLEYLRSEEKAALDFEEIVATNTLLTAPHRIASPIGTLTFATTQRAQADECLPASEYSFNPTN